MVSIHHHRENKCRRSSQRLFEFILFFSRILGYAWLPHCPWYHHFVFTSRNLTISQLSRKHRIWKGIFGLPSGKLWWLWHWRFPGIGLFSMFSDASVRINGFTRALSRQGFSWSNLLLWRKPWWFYRRSFGRSRLSVNHLVLLLNLIDRIKSFALYNPVMNIAGMITSTDIPDWLLFHFCPSLFWTIGALSRAELLFPSILPKSKRCMRSLLSNISTKWRFSPSLQHCC